MKTRMFGQQVAGAALMVVALASGACAPAVKTAVREPQPPDVHRGTTLSAAAGVSTASSQAGAVGGGALGWEITQRFGIEGSGSWLDRGTGSGAFAAALTGQTNLTSAQQWMPFLEAGIGMYRASFEPAQSTIPAFYRNRLDITKATSAVAFRDPAFVVGGGVNLFMMGHFAIRPAVEVFIVTRSPHAYPVTMCTVRAVYHFENHLTSR